MKEHQWIFCGDQSEAAKSAVDSFFAKRGPEHLGLRPSQTIENLLEQFFISLVHDIKVSVMEEVQNKIRRAVFPVSHEDVVA